MSNASTLVWFRRDLRVADNPALAAAIAAGRPVAAVYILDENRRFAPGAAQRWFLHHALSSLGESLAGLGVPLLIRKGAEAEVLTAAIAETSSAGVYWNRRYAADEIAADAGVKDLLKRRGLEARSFNGSLLRDPWEIVTKSGGPYRVFTPFWNALRAVGPARSEIASPGRATASPGRRAQADDPGVLNLLPARPNWAFEFSDWWTPGEDGARRALERFLDGPASVYETERNRPDLCGTSRLSPHLALGTISPLRIWNAVGAATASGRAPEAQGAKFLSEIAWREFAYHLLFHNPDIADAPIRKEFAGFPWRDDPAGFAAWTKGETGVPIVDAGMRQLWRTGWMHNRVRMIAASFLVKNLLIDWRKGERWFRDTLVDADPANNPAGWQWVAGCGADAAPYFRIFNPATQGEKFDPDGDYVRRFAPEYAALPNDLIHAPWKAPQSARTRQYPEPIVDLGQSRNRALAAYKQIKAGAVDLEIAGASA